MSQNNMVHVILKEHYTADSSTKSIPIPCFSEEDKAKDYIARQKMPAKYRYTSLELDPDIEGL